MRMNSGSTRSTSPWPCRERRLFRRCLRFSVPHGLPIALPLALVVALRVALFASLLIMSAACERGIDEPLTEYDIPLLAPGALRAELREACTSALDQEHPLLVEFSAPWCSDCQKLHKMKQQGVLEKELAHWPKVTINVRNFDAHRDLLKAFEVEQIAHWAVLAPSDCATAAESWPRLAQRTLEPSSGKERSQSPADLANWLLAFRAR